MNSADRILLVLCMRYEGMNFVCLITGFCYFFRLSFSEKANCVEYNKNINCITITYSVNLIGFSPRPFSAKQFL